MNLLFSKWKLFPHYSSLNINIHIDKHVHKGIIQNIYSESEYLGLHVCVCGKLFEQIACQLQ